VSGRPGPWPALPGLPHLKRDVVSRRGTAVVVAVGRGAVLVVLPRASSTTTATGATRSTASAEHHHPLADHPQLGAFLAVFFPAIKLQASSEQDAGALGQVLARDLGGASPEGDVDKGGFFHPLAVGRLAAFVHRQANIANGGVVA